MHPGRDGLIRTVTVRTEKNLLHRPVQRLHKLELHQNPPVECKISSPQNGGEKKDRNNDNQNLKSKSSVVLKGQGGEDVVARTRSGRAVVKPQRFQ